jgi:LemA protein
VIGVLVVVVLVIAALVYGVAVYNRLVALRNRFRNAYAQIDVQLKRRYDLIPNLVETAKGYLSHERETLQAVTTARANALNASQQASQTPGDPQAMRNLGGAEGALMGALGRFFAVVENYPDLKANQNMLQLSEELASTENRVAFARQAYNDSVQSYNTYRESFPPSVLASMYGFDAAQFLEFEGTEHRQAPKVTFG